MTKGDEALTSALLAAAMAGGRAGEPGLDSAALGWKSGDLDALVDPDELLRVALGQMAAIRDTFTATPFSHCCLSPPFSQK